MNAVAATRLIRHWLGTISIALLLLLPSSAGAFEAVEGRVQAHGYFEMQLRTISKNYTDQWDLTQWYNILNVELEFDLVQDRIGPLDLLSAYVRVEGRFDCIYSRGCGMISGVDLYGDRARRMPERLNRANKYTATGQIPRENEGPYANPQRDPLRVQEIPGFEGIYQATTEGLGPISRQSQLVCNRLVDGVCNDADPSNNYKPRNVPNRFYGADRNRRAISGRTLVDDGTNGAPYLIAMQDFASFRFASIPIIGGSNSGHAQAIFGPWLPENFVNPNALMANHPSPLDSSRITPESLTPGLGANPMRPIAIMREDDPEHFEIYTFKEVDLLGAPLPNPYFTRQIINPLSTDIREWNNGAALPWQARGGFQPSEPLRRGMIEGKFESYPFNFTELERAFNRGASQQDEGELKEAYLDAEFFDSRLWLRIGKQSIVWGKTELFRTTDQFNPQDFALATLPSLEESRIGLWAARGVWSFYEVGPLSDVRLELAFNFDEHESADLGACGEPYAVNLVCGITFGSWAHGLTGIGVAGVQSPPDPWDDIQGLEFGARVEWRWDRFSFALTDFYGYSDFPHPVRLSSYNRSVDWRSGRPLHYMHDIGNYWEERVQLAAAMGLAGQNPYLSGCATPVGAGVLFPVNPLTGGPDLTKQPTGAGARVGYTGVGNEGCLHPGPTNRTVKIGPRPGENPGPLPGGLTLDQYLAYGPYGVPYRVSINADANNQNDYGRFIGQFFNDTSRADGGDPRPYYSQARNLNLNGSNPWNPNDLNTRFDTYVNEYKDHTQGAGVWDWPGGPNEGPTCGFWYESTPASYAANCPTKPGPEPVNKWVDPSDPTNDESNDTKTSPQWQTWRNVVRNYQRPGARQFNDQKYLADGRLNPSYNPFYDPRMDANFDIRVANALPAGGANKTKFRYAGNPSSLSPVIARKGEPVLFDPFKVFTPQIPGGSSLAAGQQLWGNAYDPNLAYDSRNALDLSPVNNSLFNWVCSTTTGFATLDPSACALTVFSSPKPSAAGDSATRISFVFSGFLAGESVFTNFLGAFPIDQDNHKGPALPSGMAPPVVQLNFDFEKRDPNDPTPNRNLGFNGVGETVFRTWDVRRNWSDVAENTFALISATPGPAQRDNPAYPWIYTREAEAYNCIPFDVALAPGGNPLLCGGLAINNFRPLRANGDTDDRYRAATYLSKALTPEQEALMGCGPYFGIDCDSNGIDLLWAEGSAAVQAFIGTNSLGIAIADLGISHLVPGFYGQLLTDSGSVGQEYRTDGRVMDKNGSLIRIDGSGQSAMPAFGSNGYLFSGQNPTSSPVPPLPDCSVGNENATAIYNPATGATRNSLTRLSARCWDLRPYFTAYGLQPGTATFEILGLGPPKCTTGDIGGPLTDAYRLPGCRNKWATIQYQPEAWWDPATGLHPNNPDAGYIGNNWVGQRMTYKRPRFTLTDPNQLNPRSDYRQWRQCRKGFENPDGSCDQWVVLADPTEADLVNNPLSNGGTGCGSGNDAASDRGIAANYDCWLFDPTPIALDVNRAPLLDANGNTVVLAALPGLGTNAAVRWSTEYGSGPGDPRYAAAVASRRSGLNWGVYSPGTVQSDPGLPGCPLADRADPDCYIGGWHQTVDGDPDRLGSFTNNNQIIFPAWTGARGISGLENAFGALGYGERVENGCTLGSDWVYLQRTAANQLLPPTECAAVHVSPNTIAGGPTAWPAALTGGSGHPFTGESFSSEIAGVSFNLMMLLVAFSDDFQDGLASVRGFVQPEIYESRFIYDEAWMWDKRCHLAYAGADKMTLPECGGRSFKTDNGLPDGLPAYGDPNRDLDGNPSRVRQLAGWFGKGVHTQNVTNNSSRQGLVPNPLPDGVSNRLQRDPSLPNILTVFPDLAMRECTLARTAAGAAIGGFPIGDARNCSAVGHWDIAAQERRLGNRPQGFGASGSIGGLAHSMQWDYAFTGSENNLMALIPYCEGLDFSQRNVAAGQADVNSGQVGVTAISGPVRIDCSRGLAGETLGRERCTYITPQYCDLVEALFGVAGQKRNIVRAGGNGYFGRRTMQWQSGGEIYLAYEKRNVLGFSTDFAEDYTKSNWSMEFTWIEGLPQFDNSSYDLTTKTDDFNLTVSVDRPTFINFLNANRTFFINSQWFFQYKKGYNDEMTTKGPFNVLATLAVFTGYFQDRLNPTMVFVYDFNSKSGGALPQVNYRFSENFSITVGASIFMGEQQLVDMPVNGIAPAAPRAGVNAYQDAIEPGLSLIRDRDEVFMTLRYTF